jgi:hypothetical protein
VVERNVPAVLEIEPGVGAAESYEISLGRTGREEVVLAVTVFVR